MNDVPAPFRRYVLAGSVAIGLYFLLPQAVQNLAILASNVVAVVAMLVALRMRRLNPRSGWLLLAGFPAATAVGNAIYFYNDSVLHVQPFPSVGDVFFLGGYLLLAAGLLRLQHARSAGRDMSAVLDTAIITLSFAAASWVFFMSQTLRDGTALAETITALGYPVADVLAVAVTVRFFFSRRRRSPVFGWLAGTVVVMLVADTAFAALNLLGLYTTGHPIDALILAYNLGWGAVALHRDVGDLTVASSKVGIRPSRWRLTALTLASLIPPTVLLAQVAVGRLEDVLVTAASAAALFSLVVWRMAGLVRALETVLRQRRELEAALHHRAQHDDLTGLANRRTFTERLQHALEGTTDSSACVLFLDLDRFKAVNDSLGHGAGDGLLVTVARRLQDALEPEDLVARLGGDEFAVLLGDSTDRPLDHVCAVITAAVEQPVTLQGLDVRVSASIGSAMVQHGDTLEALMHRADTAMYAQKARTERRAQLTPALSPVPEPR